MIADEIDCGNFFDHIDDLLDFPTENLDDVAFTNVAAFPPIWTTHSDSLPSAVVDPVFSADTGDSGLSAELPAPYDDMVQLEWLSNFVDDSFSGAGTLTINTSSLSPSNQFHTSSPVSVLDSSSSSSSSSSSDEKKALATAAGRRGRARSKRPRPPSFIPRPPQLISPTNSGGKVSSESDNYAESCSPPPPAKKPKKIKLSYRRDQNDAFNPQGVRKCLHCEVTKTPQWRAGPLGPKTLCNACGVRYKSGRLYPEYRPAASPTFVPCLHSNSHKKVLEMRIKQVEKGAGFTAEESPPELIPNTNSGIILGYV
ncbi:GATA transcription factor 8-like [Benincasa hispida]|uniref:GATA transcription factor 8-like n=1 Tax=Benincasa hispida TaxID=102211 RepID=UPI001902BFA0|nr:GATA transcription factor 8-like [Benincasa hispida]